MKKYYVKPLANDNNIVFKEYYKIASCVIIAQNESNVHNKYNSSRLCRQRTVNSGARFCFSHSELTILFLKYGTIWL